MSNLKRILLEKRRRQGITVESDATFSDVIDQSKVGGRTDNSVDFLLERELITGIDTGLGKDEERWRYLS